MSNRRSIFCVPSGSFFGNNSWIHSAFEDMDRLFGSSNPPVNFPPVNIQSQPDGTLLLDLALAGYSQEEISITAEDGKIIIEGKIKSDSEDEFMDPEEMIYKGIRHSNFKVYYPVGSKFELSKIVAKFKNGVLSIKAPIAEERKPKKVEVSID